MKKELLFKINEKTYNDAKIIAENKNLDFTNYLRELIEKDIEKYKEKNIKLNEDEKNIKVLKEIFSIGDFKK